MNNIKSLLEEKGITIRQIARDLGISTTFVSLIVHRHKVSRPTAGYIEQILGAEPGSLFPYILKPIVRGRKAKEINNDARRNRLD